jgi:hypothetical protein
MDTITAGNLCALTIEGKAQGRLDYEIEYGEVDRIADLIQKMAARDDIGDILADGIGRKEPPRTDRGQGRNGHGLWRICLTITTGCGGGTARVFRKTKNQWNNGMVEKSFHSICLRYSQYTLIWY